MGVNLSELLIKHQKTLEQLKNKVIAIDAFNTLYQFLASIRQPDGTPLMDFKGRVTSHLSGMFYRTLNLIRAGITPVYVFDGKPPEFKIEERERRKALREEAELKFEKASDLEDEEKMLSYAKATQRLTKGMVEETKKLLDYMGVNYVDAPSEGEAQAAHMAKNGIVDASASQDYDSLLFGSPILIRNLSITGKRKLPRKDEYIIVHPEEINLKENLDHLGISQKQLVFVGLLVGTDFNEGIKGIGPKKALELVKRNDEKTLKSLLNAKDETFREGNVDIDEVLEFFENPPVVDVSLERKEINEDGIIELLVEEHDFSEARVRKSIEELKAALMKNRQKTLDQWF